ncbi:protein brawnin [Glossina fuscipes]|uniref:Protein brawnin n=1 Tax=Glossina fuscipes TaxID=7396 RepID=A0A9C6DSH9_9MUSC|nr:protein brawnin [Glossina fuscipes]
MPAGVSWGQYLKFISCALCTMLAGAQIVHMYYKPLEDLDKYIEKEMKDAQVRKSFNKDKIVS